MRKFLRKLLYPVFCIVAMVSIFSIFYVKTVDAATGTVYNWYSDNWYQVGYWPSSPTTFITNLNTSISYVPYFNTAVSNWNNAGISSLITTSPSNAKIFAYGGTRAELNLTYFTYDSGTMGLTKYQGSYAATITYSSSSGNRDEYVYSFEKVYTSVCQEAGTNYYTHTALHEYGHSLGWIGHNINNNSVMYNSASTLTNLQSTDTMQLTQIYNIMN